MDALIKQISHSATGLLLVSSWYPSLFSVVPDLNLELVTTNYLGGPLDWSLVQNDVEAALQRPTYPNNNNPRLSVKEIEVYYGLEVLEFIMSEAKKRDLWTGKHPDNRRVSQLKDRCVVMWCDVLWRVLCRVLLRDVM